MNTSLPQKINRNFSGTKRTAFIFNTYALYKEAFEKLGVEIDVTQYKFAELYQLLRQLENQNNK